MSESSAGEQLSEASLPAESRTAAGSLRASKGHQLLTLIGVTFIFFEIIFVQLYSDKFWFSSDISWMGVPAILVVALLAHVFLLFLQSDRACRWFFFLWRGKPPVFYTRWVDLHDGGFKCGIRHIQYSAIDALHLTFFGNLEVRSYALSGAHSGEPDVLFKFPFAAASQEEQRQLVDAVRAARPNLQANKRLESRMNSPIIKGQNAIQLVGAAFMALVLFDLGNSSMAFLEMLKHYYLAQSAGVAGDSQTAAKELAIADRMHTNRFPISWVTSKLYDTPAVSQARAAALWAGGQRQAALADVEKAIGASPNEFRLYLMKARYLAAMGRKAEADAAILQAIEHHKNSLLPRLYLVSNAHGEGKRAMDAAYEKAMTELKESTFGDEPNWPPVIGNRFMSESLYSDDIRFVFDPLFKETAGRR